MSRKTRRFLVLSLTLVMMVSWVLTGCGSSKTNTPEATPTPAQTTQSTPSASAGAQDPATPQAQLPAYEIKWLMPNGVQPDMDSVNAEMSKITKEKINATLKVEFVDWGSYDQKVQVMMAAAEPMDLIFTSNWSNDYITGVNKNAYLEISQEKLQTLAPNVLEGVPEKCWPAAQVKGKLYAIINTQVEGRTPGVFGYKKYTDKYGFDLKSVTKMEQLTPFLEQIKAGEPGIIPIEIDGTRPWFNDIALTYGMEIFSNTNPAALYTNDDTATVMNYFAAPETKAYLKLVHEWYLKGYIRRDASTVSDYLADLKAGKIALMTNVLNPDTIANQAALWGVTADEMVGQPFMNTFMGTGGIIATMTAISKTSGDPDRCYMLYNLLYDKNDTRLFNIMNYGIEDKHYTKEGDVVTPIANSGYWISCGWEYGNMFNSFKQSVTQPDWYPIGPQMNDTAETSKVLGFSFDPEPVKDQLTQCTAVINEYYNGLFTGSVDPDKYLPEFLGKLTKAGSETVVAEMQKQIDEWKKTK